MNVRFGSCLTFSLFPTNLTLADCNGSRNQQFSLTNENFLRVYDTDPHRSSYCLSFANESFRAHLCDKIVNKTKWVYDIDNKNLIIDDKCLSMDPDNWPTSVRLEICGHWSLHKWQFEFTNFNNSRKKAFDLPTTKITDEISDVEMLAEDEQNLVLVEHHQFTEGRAIERENLLAREIRQVYCNLRKFANSRLLL